ncbi:hypothetical protein KVP40.0011 [Vibrio phage KVP40]|uniref:Glutaredoxin n=1 Tax=Vibrio phage KVP40 (isolate Vibrio parahaemolyticus/Japan/Matsuzaki/1991) TaxID=75320 RepID=Q6WIE0_BPKVM|nr:hypothetical protein KVP40.0011 [Vibrio phage KVP40]AAQ64082.1 hypothetical protein KVP40.0011 [Vibrio phage KVP40]
MVEIIGSKYCLACRKLCETLDNRDIKYTFYDAFVPNERYVILQKIAEDEGYIAHPIAFYNGECLGEGVSVLSRIDKRLEEE